MRALERSPDIQVEGLVIRRAAEGEKSEIDDSHFAKGRYNVYVLSDLPADFFPRISRSFSRMPCKPGRAS